MKQGKQHLSSSSLPSLPPPSPSPVRLPRRENPLAGRVVFLRVAGRHPRLETLVNTVLVPGLVLGFGSGLVGEGGFDEEGGGGGLLEVGGRELGEGG